MLQSQTFQKDISLDSWGVTAAQNFVNNLCQAPIDVLPDTQMQFEISVLLKLHERQRCAVPSPKISPDVKPAKWLIYAHTVILPGN